MKRIVITTLGLALAVVLWGSVRAEEAKEPAGKKLFLANKCNSCHTIDAAGVEKLKSETAAAEKKEAPAGEKTAATPAKKAPDLSSIGTDQTAEWLTQFLKKEVAAKDGKKHMKLWKGTDGDLATITSWLAEQKAEKKEAKAAETSEAKPADDAAKPADDAAKPAETKAPETKTPETGK